MERIPRVLVVNDSGTVRAALRKALGARADLEIVGEAADGAEAVRLVEELRPSVVLMDVVMPHLDGYAATRAIMGRRPTPIVLVSSVVDPRDIRVAMEALRSGALAVTDGLPSPQDPSYATRVDALAQMLRSMARVRFGKRAAAAESPPPPPVTTSEPGAPPLAIGIAASTGGPQALAELLRALPAGRAPPLLIVQHMSPGFMSGFAEWLASTTPHHVAIAEPGRTLERGDVLVAPEDRHLGVDASLRAIVSDGEAIGRFRPSGTFLFRSLARALGPRALGVVLTGMGDDAAAGALDLRRAGGRVIAQDESSSVIYGMPRAALARGGVDRVLPLSEIAHALIANEARCEP